MTQVEKSAIDYARERLSNDDYPYYNDEYEIMLAFEAGIAWQKEKMTKKALEWIKKNISYDDCGGEMEWVISFFSDDELIDNFVKFMEDET